MKKLKIEKTIVISKSIDQVFEALTNPELVVQYYPLNKVHSDLQVGGEIICEGDGFTDYGKIEIIEPNHQFQYSYWSDNHGTDRSPENYLTISYLLHTQEQNKTLLSLTHSNLHSELMYSQMSEVWDFLLDSFLACFLFLFHQLLD